MATVERVLLRIIKIRGNKAISQNHFIDIMAQMEPGNLDK